MTHEYDSTTIHDPTFTLFRKLHSTPHTTTPPHYSTLHPSPQNTLTLLHPSPPHYTPTPLHNPHHSIH